MNSILKYIAMAFAMLAVSATYAGATSTSPSTTALSCNVPLTTIYIGHSATCGQYTVVLTDLSQPNSHGVSKALFSVYSGNTLVRASRAIKPGSSWIFVLGPLRNHLTVHVSQTFAGLYAYQKWAKITITGT